MLRTVIAEPVCDVQDWPAWRALVAEAILQLRDHYSSTVIVPMTVLRQDDATDISSVLSRRGAHLRHVIPHASDAALIRRIENDHADRGARAGRLDHLARDRDALGWLRAHGEVDTTDMAPVEAARRVGPPID